MVLRRGSIEYSVLVDSKVAWFSSTYARDLRQSGNVPFADIGRRINRRDIGLFNERFAHDVHDEGLGRPDVPRGVLEAARSIREGH